MSSEGCSSILTAAVMDGVVVEGMRVPGRNFDAKPVRSIECRTCVSVTRDIITILRKVTKFDVVFKSSMS